MNYHIWRSAKMCRAMQRWRSFRITEWRMSQRKVLKEYYTLKIGEIGRDKT